MNDAQRETSTTGSGAATEDLNVLLSRFQSWSAGRSKSSPPAMSEKPGTQARAASDAAVLSSGVREISYEQAVRASRYRRQEDVVPSDPIPAPANVGKRQPQIDTRVAKEDLPSPAASRNDDQDWGLKSRVSRWPEFSFSKASAAIADSPASVPASGGVFSPAADSIPATQWVAAPAPFAAAAGPAAAKAAKPIKPASAHVQAKHDRCEAPLASNAEAAADIAAAAGPSAAAAAPAGPRSEATFAEVLKRTSAKSSPASARSVCLTLQAADGEQARLQEGAGKGNLSGAVYLRQCSLGMDELRVQMEIALSRMRREQQGNGRIRAAGASLGLRQFGAWCRKRLHRSNSDLPGLSTR